MSRDGESPGHGGYPDLAKPQTRVTTAYRSLWTQALVKGPRDAKRAMTIIHQTRVTLGRKRA